MISATDVDGNTHEDGDSLVFDEFVGFAEGTKLNSGISTSNDGTSIDFKRYVQAAT